LARVGLVIVALAVALTLVEWTIDAFDLFGVHYNEEVHRYHTELCELRLTGADSQPDLDGTLFEQKPGARAEFHDFTVELNSLGFRGPEIEPDKPADSYRVLVLGDSVTFGWGVDDEATFVRRLERRWNARDDGRRYEVVNTGHLAYDTTQELRLLERRGLALEPDAVVLVFVGNDIEPTRKLAEAFVSAQTVPATDPVAEPAPAAEPPAADLTRWVRAWLPWTSAVVNRVLHPPPTIVATDGRPDAPRPELTETHAAGWERSKQALLAMRDLCGSRGIRFAVLDYGFYDVPSLPEFCGEHGIPYASIKLSQDELEQPIYNSLFDPHVNATGHELVTTKVERALAGLGLPD
jgi:lysophospholipase L1-like esterase